MTLTRRDREFISGGFALLQADLSLTGSARQRPGLREPREDKAREGAHS
jgi:hypothetical protein